MIKNCIMQFCLSLGRTSDWFEKITLLKDKQAMLRSDFDAITAFADTVTESITTVKKGYCCIILLVVLNGYFLYY